MFVRMLCDALRRRSTASSRSCIRFRHSKKTFTFLPLATEFIFVYIFIDCTSLSEICSHLATPCMPFYERTTATRLSRDEPRSRAFDFTAVSSAKRPCLDQVSTVWYGATVTFGRDQDATEGRECASAARTSGHYCVPLSFRPLVVIGIDPGAHSLATVFQHREQATCEQRTHVKQRSSASGRKMRRRAKRTEGKRRSRKKRKRHPHHRNDRVFVVAHIDARDYHHLACFG